MKESIKGIKIIITVLFFLQILLVSTSWPKTWWFKLISVLIVLGLLLLLYQVRMIFFALRETYEIKMDVLFSKQKITKREKEIVRLLLRGENKKSIEKKLFISQSTVKNHIYNIYQKLGVKNRLQLFNLFQ
jgi:DNA-binding CsgD family transcriptional regulator